MNAKHTPGPWLESRKSKSTILQSIDIKVGSERIAYVTVPYTAKNIEECEANARLIAAAPDLLEACRKALYALKGREHDQFLRDAIAKATNHET
jgi:hypothetical protein